MAVFLRHPVRENADECVPEVGPWARANFRGSKGLASIFRVTLGQLVPRGGRSGAVRARAGPSGRERLSSPFSSSRSSPASSSRRSSPSPSSPASPVQPSPAQLSQAQSNPVQPSPARPGPARPSPAQSSPVQSRVQSNPVQRASSFRRRRGQLAPIGGHSRSCQSGVVS